jgi:hypothetical protein
MKIIRVFAAIILVAIADIAAANCNGQPSGLATCGSAPCQIKANTFENGVCNPI